MSRPASAVSSPSAHPLAGSALIPETHQREALEAVAGALKDGGRTQVVMACGTGKTLVGRWAAEHHQSVTAAVFCPSLALVAQTIREWRAAGGWQFEAIVTCSDPTTAEGARERADGDPAAPWWSRYGARVTTQPGHVLAALNRARPGRPVVVFSTYHSAQVVREAVTSWGNTLDLVIADEAHHLAGSPRQEFRTVVDGSLPARASLYMTATLVTAGANKLSMDDEATFGRVAYRLTFGEAIRRGLLCDYQVLVYEAAGTTRPDAISALVGGATPDVNRVLTFHGRVRKAQGFAAELDRYVLPDGRTVSAQAVAGTDNVAARERALAILREPAPGVLALVASARCLAEGVNLPAVDAVMFADPKTSEVDIVQAVGRVLRTAPGKTIGTVLVPVVVPSDVDDDSAMSVTAYAHVWKVLRALRSIDPRLADELDAITRGTSRHGVAVRGRVQFRVPSLADVQALTARTVDFASTSWEQRLDELVRFAQQHGHATPTKSTSLGVWCDMQRRSRHAGMLSDQREAALDAVSGWVWDVSEYRWRQQLDQVHVLAERSGTLPLRDADAMDAPLHFKQTNGPRTVGEWCARQRIIARAGDLDPRRRSLVEQVPGWRWDILAAHDAACVDLLAEYVAWKNDANVPERWSEDGLDLGVWLRKVRRARALGHLDRPLIDELTAVTPRRSAAGALRWYRGQCLWLVGLEAMWQFVRREGHARVPDGHVEALTDTEIPLSMWCRNQRRERRHGRMTDSMAALLDKVPGWRWEILPAPRVLMNIGDTPHGTRTGYIKGCHCDDCSQANTDDASAREARIRDGTPASDWVDAARSRGHLLILLGRGATRNGLARATGLNPKTIDNIVDGVTARVIPQTQQTVLSCTLAAVNEASADMPGARVAAGPTWELIDDLLERGWPAAWIAREAGLGGALQLSRDSVTATNARRVRDLHERVGALRAPKRQRGVPTPTLAELLTCEAVAA